MGSGLPWSKDLRAGYFESTILHTVGMAVTLLANPKP